MTFILRRMFHRKWSTVSFFLIFIFFFSIIPFGIYQSWEMQVIVNETIDNNSRGTYDILVRPANARTEIELAYHTIEENYVGDGKGGISVDEWTDISENPLIEIAAPVASLGYMCGINYSLQIPLPSDKESARYKLEFFTTDGLKTYPIGETQYTYVLEDSNWDKEKYFNHQIVREELDYALMQGYILERVPDSYHLLVAIDPVSEEQMTGISYKELLEDISLDSLQQHAEMFPDIPIIKVLQREGLTVPLSVRISVDTIDVNIKDLLHQVDLAEGNLLVDRTDHPNYGKVINQLKKTPSLGNTVVEKDLTTWQHPFAGSPLTLSEDWEFQEESNAYLTDYSRTTVYYVADPVEYIEENNLLMVKKVGNGNIPIYKNIEKVGDAWETTFLIGDVGEFSPSIADENKLTSSPLGMYSIPTVLNANSEQVIPTALPGSFIASAASGVTTLEAAESIKGDKPIDAIRIRVAGITTYNNEAQKKIEEVATALLKQGYEVDIVAGSSLREQTLEVEGIGKVMTPWTTLGIAPMLKMSWNQVTFIMVSLFCIFGLCCFFSRLMIERATLAEEREILAQIGWTKREIRYHELKGQFFSLVVINIIAACVLGILSVPAYVYKLNFILFCIVLTFAMIFTIGKARKLMSRKTNSKFPAIHYYRPYVFQSALIVSMAYITISLLLINILHSFEVFHITTLGEFTFGTIFWMQVILIIIGIFMTITSSSESISVFLKERKEEFRLYKSVGWTEKRIFRHFLKEASLWMSLSFFIGMLFVFLFSFWLQYSLINVVIILLGTMFILVTLMVITIRGCIYRFLKTI